MKELKKGSIVVTYSCFGKHVKMEIEKDVVLKDYEKYTLYQTLRKKPIDSIKILIRKKMFDVMMEALKSEHSHCYYRY